MLKQIKEKILETLTRKRKKVVKQQHVRIIPFDKDKIFEDYNFKYSPLDIKKFLKKYNSFLLTYKIGQMPVIDWIEKSCQDFNVNPKLILTLLEKEFGFVKQFKTPALETLKDLDKKIYNCARLHRRWYNLAGNKLKNKINCVDQEVEPQNAFTYALYMCDPYVGTEDLYNRSIVKDENGDPVEERTRLEKPSNPLLYLASLISEKYMVKIKVIKQDIKLVKKTPFGVYSTYKIWRNLFGV